MQVVVDSWNGGFSNILVFNAYIDFQNAFGSIDHARLLSIMEDLGFPVDAIELISNMYVDSMLTTLELHQSLIVEEPSKETH